MADVITGVALLGKDGAMIALPRPSRHCHLFALAAFLGLNLNNAAQGFVSCDGVFVSRETAFKMVHKAGQANKRSGSPASTQLFSEDVW